MASLVLDTAHQRPVDRYDWWSTTMEVMVGIATVQTQPEPFEGSLSMVSSPSLTQLRFTATNCVATRQARQIRRLEWGQYFVYREFGSGAQFEIGGRRFVTNPGDLLIYDADGAFRAEAKTAFRHHIWTLPKAMLDPHLPPLPRPLAVHVPARGGIADLAVAYLDMLSSVLAELTEAQGALIADHLGRLIAIACGCATGGHRAAVEEAKLAQAHRYIAAHLSQPQLGPETTAAELEISVRRLQALFQPTGETFGQHVRRRRLAEVKAALESPLARGRSVTDIALGWGFASLPTFYRAFAAEFNATPGDIRQAALDQCWLHTR